MAEPTSTATGILAVAAGAFAGAAMVALIAFVVIVANAATALRLLTYRRRPARYRLWASGAAYVLIVCTGGQALSVLVHGTPGTVWQAGVSVVLAILAHRARGNVARIVRVAP